MEKHKITYGLFYDNHTHVENPDVGKDFDAEYFTDQLLRCGVNYLGFHARCNTGMSYYNTKIGTRHPALTYDMFGTLAAACKKKEIALVAYLNGGISTEEAIQHIDWRTIPFEGENFFGKLTPFAITMCYNSPFRDHLIAMVKEIAQNYPVHGFFIDCLGAYPCVCPRCVKMMKEQSIDWSDKKSVIEFSRQSVLRFCKDITAAAREVITDKEPLLYFNGPGFAPAREFDTFFDCECLPTAGWGYEFLPTYAHFARNICNNTHQVLNMTGRFYDWGDFGGLRNFDALAFDLHYGLAHGMRPNIGGHIHPRGDKDQAVFDRICEVYKEMQKYEKYYDDAVNKADIAIVMPRIINEKATRSCVRMLEELKLQFDVLIADGAKAWDDYKLLILPEEIEVTPLLAEKIRTHIAKGGAFFACGKNAGMEFGAELGVASVEDSGMDPVYFRMKETFSEGLDDMYLTLYAPACKSTLNGAERVANLVKPYYNRGWNGTNAVYYTPPQEEVDMPFLTAKGKCVWCSGDFFSGYFKRGALHLRKIFRNIVMELLDQKTVLVNGNLPAYVRCAVTEQPGGIVNTHLIAYLTEKRGETAVVEDAGTVVNGTFKLFTGGKKVRSVTRALSDEKISYTVEGDYIVITVKEFTGYAIISVELE